METATLANITRESPTGILRWVPLSSMQAHRRRLQQEWVIWTYEGGNLVGQFNEWRDVPMVAES